jgi:hypothetical protein
VYVRVRECILFELRLWLASVPDMIVVYLLLPIFASASMHLCVYVRVCVFFCVLTPFASAH